MNANAGGRVANGFVEAGGTVRRGPVDSDTTAPTVLSLVINAAGDAFTLTASEAVKIGAGGNGGLTLASDGGAVTLTYASGSGTAALVYTPSRKVFSFEAITATYVQPGNGIEDLAGNDLASFSGTAVTNNSTQDILANMSFEEYWNGINAPGHAPDGSASDWNDVGNTKTLTSATKFLYKTNLGSDFNGKPGFQGVSADSRFMEWARGSDLAQTYSVTTYGCFDSLANYAIMTGALTGTKMFPWLQKDTATPNTGKFLYEEANLEGSSLARGCDTVPHLWSFVANGATTKYFKDGCGQIAAAGSDALNGITLGRLPGTNAFYGDVRIAFVAVSANDISTQTYYAQFQYYMAKTYANTRITGTHIWDMGDSKCAGTGNTSATTEAAAQFTTFPSTAAQFDAQAAMLMQKAYTQTNVQTAGQSAAGRSLATQTSDAPTTLAVAISASIATKKVVMTWNIDSNGYAAGTGAASYARVVTWINYVHSLGAQCLIGDLPNYIGATEPARTDLNVLINANSGAADKVLPLAGQTGMNYLTSPGNFTLDSLHLTDLGNVALQALAEVKMAEAPISVT